jgi:hypothetical protein
MTALSYAIVVLAALLAYFVPSPVAARRHQTLSINNTHASIRRSVVLPSEPCTRIKD